MSKCPCIKCICFAICRNNDSIITLMKKCEWIRDYIHTPRNALAAIKILEPSYLSRAINNDKLQRIANIIIDTKMDIRYD